MVQGRSGHPKPTKVPPGLHGQLIWAPAQASAVFELLDELREWVWLCYGSQIQQELRRGRVVTTSAVPSNLGDEDVPF